MNCEHLRRVLDAYVDDELDDGTRRQVQAHLGSCLACARQLDDREALRTGLRQLPRHQAPLALHQGIAAALATEAPASTATVRAPVRHAAVARPGLRRAAVAAGAMAALALSFGLGVWVASPPTTQDLREEVIARHVASFDGDAPRVQVASTDRHTVKPWFGGRIDLAPPVRDLSAQGYLLVGGRIDSLAGQPAAVLVYRIRKHQVSLFVTRTAEADSGPPQATQLHGFAVAAWVQAGLALHAVADVDAAELRRFATLMQAPWPAPQPAGP